MGMPDSWSPASLDSSENPAEPRRGSASLRSPLPHSPVVSPAAANLKSGQRNSNNTFLLSRAFPFLEVSLGPFNVYSRACVCAYNCLTKKTTSFKCIK